MSIVDGPPGYLGDQPGAQRGERAPESEKADLAGSALSGLCSPTSADARPCLGFWRVARSRRQASAPKVALRMSRVRNGQRVVSASRPVVVENAPKVYSIREVADLLGLSAPTVRAYVKSGALVVTHELAPASGGSERTHYRISAAEVQRFLDAHAVRPSPRDGDSDPDGGVF